MKYISKHTALLLLFLLPALVSCKKSFLEITPKGRVIASTITDYDLLFNSQSLLNSNSDAQVLMGDETVAIEPFFSSAELRTQRLFKWEDEIYNPQEFSNEMNSLMPMIYSFNKVVNEADNAEQATPQQKQALIAEAKANRAWCYFMLINYYGKPFNTATSGQDPGFPIVTVADVSQTRFTRGTVLDVYNFIVKDLTEAIGHLPSQVKSRVRMSKQAAQCLLGKVYVFMGKFDDAIPLFESALTNLSSLNVQVGLYDYNNTFANGGEFLPLGPFGPRYPNTFDNKENLFAKQFLNSWSFAFSEVLLAPETTGLFNSADLRLNFYSNTAFFGPAFDIPGVLRRISPGATQFGIVLPDVYLLSAECKARRGDITGAKEDLYAVRSRRMPLAEAVVPDNLNSVQLTEFIITERIREFAVQGYRWFDMRRLSVDPLFSGKTYKHIHYLSESEKETYVLKPQRLTMRFPRVIIDQNPGMLNNP